MGIIIWLIFGGIIGWLASVITKNDEKMGLVANIVVGIVGSIIGGWIASLLHLGTFSTFHIGGLLLSLLGAVILLTLINLFKGKRQY